MNLKMLTKSKFVLQSSLAFISLCLLQLTTWIPLRYWGAWGGGNFLDTWQILRYGKCYETVGLSVYENAGSNCSNYLYGRTLLQLLSILGIDVSLTQFFGYTFLLLLAVGLTIVFPITSRKDFLVFIMVLFSPPVMLLADRGNFDILIFFILILVAKSIARGNIFLGYILLTASVLLKYYTAPVFLLLIFYSRRSRDRIVGLLLLLICTGLSLRDIAITEAQYPHGSNAQFGFSVWGEYLNKYSSTQVNQIQKYSIATMVFGLILVLAFLSTRKFEMRAINFYKPSEWQQYAFWIFFTVSITCYFAGMNFDYRLIFFASTFLLASRILPDLFPQTLVNTLMIVLWLSFPSGGLQPIGDLILEIVIAVAITIIYISSKKGKVELVPSKEFL